MWGIGGVLVLYGATSMTFHEPLKIDYPQYVIVGSIEMFVGTGLYIFDGVMRHLSGKSFVKNKNTKETK